MDNDVWEEFNAIQNKVREESNAIRDRFEVLSLQLECVRRMQALLVDLHDLRANAVKATFAAEGEDGYIPQRETGWWPSSQEVAQWSVFELSETVNEYFENIYTDEFSSSVLLTLIRELRYFARETREAAKQSFTQSLNQTADSCRSLDREFWELQKTVYQERQRLEEERQKTRRERRGW